MGRRSAGLSALVCCALAFGGCLDLTHVDGPASEQTLRLLSDPHPASGPGPRLDVAIAFGCPADEPSGEASACERCRVKSALRAYRDGEVGAVLMTGGAAHSRHVEAEAMGRLALRRGLPASALILEPRALTTWMNLRYAQRLMRERHLHTALFVSTADHLPRVKRFADWFGIPGRYRACDRDEPHDSDDEWRGPLRPRDDPDPAPAAQRAQR